MIASDMIDALSSANNANLYAGATGGTPRPFFLMGGFVRPHGPWMVPMEAYLNVNSSISELPTNPNRMDGPLNAPYHGWSDAGLELPPMRCARHSRMRRVSRWCPCFETTVLPLALYPPHAHMRSLALPSTRFHVPTALRDAARACLRAPPVSVYTRRTCTSASVVAVVMCARVVTMICARRVCTCSQSPYAFRRARRDGAWRC
jgi:hypothetical protein